MTDTPDLNDKLKAGQLTDDPLDGERLRLVAGPREPGDDTEQIHADERASATAEQYHVATMAELLQDLWLRAQSQEQVSSVSMCHRELDSLTDGFRPRMVTTLGAVTSWGKTTYAVMVVDEAVQLGKRALIITVEDAKELYARRFAARRANLNAAALRSNKLNDDELAKLSMAADAAPHTRVLLDACGRPIEWICKALRAVCRVEPYDLIVLDYLQRTGTAHNYGENISPKVAYIAETFANVVKEVGASGLMLSQLKRLDPPNRRPTKHDLKFAGEVENVSDHILLGHSIEGPKVRGLEPVTERFLRLAKNKDGKLTGHEVRLGWDDTTAAFEVGR